ncbi:MAG: hypothetical protein AB2708_08930 [Candidatus Thiodiazotropha taylori]
MQAKFYRFRRLGKPIILFPGRDGLQRKYFASQLRADGNAVAN